MLPSMIGILHGKLSEKGTDSVIVDVGGVGYEVYVPLGTLARLPKTGESVTLYIHTHVREDDLRLFGFESKSDKTAFQTMLKVSGVGPKLAVTVLGALSGPDLARVIDGSDVKRLTAIPGIGKKTAERMILELSGKLKQSDGGGALPTSGGVFADLGSALTNLGFKPAQVERILGEMRGRSDSDTPFATLLREALSLLKETK
jgi:Holliday junction DNA helicase RuvA